MFSIIQLLYVDGKNLILIIGHCVLEKTMDDEQSPKTLF
jgi:hypothetical protein